jgi:Ca2+-binding EF-hand superfamily protein
MYDSVAAPFIHFQDYDECDLLDVKDTILQKWDVNNDGKINKEELKMILLASGKIASEDD